MIVEVDLELDYLVHEGRDLQSETSKHLQKTIYVYKRSIAGLYYEHL